VQARQTAQPGVSPLENLENLFTLLYFPSSLSPQSGSRGLPLSPAPCFISPSKFENHNLTLFVTQQAWQAFNGTLRDRGKRTEEAFQDTVL
jgi:hypothetical protein